MIFTRFAVNFFIITALSSSLWGNDGGGKFGRAVSAQEHEHVRIHLSKEEASSVLVDGRDLLDPDSDPLAGMNDGTGKFGRAVSAQEHEGVQIHVSKEEASSVLVDSRDSLDPDSDPLAVMNDGTGKFGRAVSAQEHEGVQIHLSKEEASSVLVDGHDSLDPDSDPLAGMNDGTGIRKLSKKGSKNMPAPIPPPKSSKKMPTTTPVATHRPTFNPSPPPMPPPPVDPTDDVFIPAAPLDTFKSIDPKEFEWINKNNIVAGKTTCGFLKPDLGSDTDTIIYPKIKVYMCVRFAKNQPAAKGNMVVHCGGPNSLSDCKMVDIIGQNNVDNYNVVSIDQRGMGRSSPSLVHQECAYTSHRLEVNSRPAEYTSDIVQEILDKQKKVVSACWSCKKCGFHMKGTRKEDNSEIKLNFLEYSGTRQLAEDLFRFANLIDSKKLSLYGISYGTNVMGTFATIFPSRVDKFVIDSNMQPESQLLPFAYGKAVGFNMRTDYMIYTCSAARAQDPKLCPIEDLRKCLTSVGDIVYDELGASIGLRILNEYIFPLIVRGDPEDMKLATDLCEKASQNDGNGVIDVLCVINVDFLNCNGDGDESRAESSNCDEYDGPTSERGNCFAVSAENYKDYSGNTLTLMVDGMDYAGGQSAYNDKFFIQKVMDFQYSQDDMTALFIEMMLSNYNWPKNIPLPIRGHPSITGIVSGQIWDPKTEYKWTQEMRANFPNTHLLTSQSNEHGLNNNPICQANINKYFETGSVGFVDGNICGDTSDAFHNFVR